MVDSLTTSASLLLRLRDPRDGKAWGEFVDTYAPLVHRFCRKQGLQDADAADITQDVLSRVFRAIPKLEYDPARGGFRKWLFTAVRNRLRDYFDQQRRKSKATGDSKVQQQLAEAPERGGGMELEWDREYRRHLYAAAARAVASEVTAPTWQAFQRTAVEGREPAEVAAELKLSVAAVYLAKSRVMARLRAAVQGLETD
jgi:RNA polymerase sigma factor (sigma-70 family)